MVSARLFLLLGSIFIGVYSQSAFASSKSCLNAQLALLEEGPVVAKIDVDAGKVLAAEFSEQIIKEAGPHADQVFASMKTLSPEDLSFFKDELRAGTWKWTCD